MTNIVIVDYTSVSPKKYLKLSDPKNLLFSTALTSRNYSLANFTFSDSQQNYWSYKSLTLINDYVLPLTTVSRTTRPRWCAPSASTPSTHSSGSSPSSSSTRVSREDVNKMRRHMSIKLGDVKKKCMATCFL